MNLLGTKQLKTPRCTVRRFTMDDVDAMYTNWANDPDVTQYLTWEPHPDRAVTRAVLETWVARYGEGGYFVWGIEYEGQLMGNISVVHCSQADEWGEIGYCIGRRWWGLGIMTEVLDAVLAFLLGEVGLHRVMLRYDVQNIASGRVMAKCGLVPEGVLREHHRRRDGTWADMAVCGMLQEEWQAGHRAPESGV